MDRHRQVFNRVLEASKYLAKEVSDWTGIDKSKISRFRSGKLDLGAGEFFDLLERCPEDFQAAFWIEFRNAEKGKNWRSLVMEAAPQEEETLRLLVKRKGWGSLIASADHDDIVEILHLVADRWTVFQKQVRESSKSTDESSVAAVL